MDKAEKAARAAALKKPLIPKPMFVADDDSSDLEILSDVKPPGDGVSNEESVDGTDAEPAPPKKLKKKKAKVSSCTFIIVNVMFTGGRAEAGGVRV